MWEGNQVGELVWLFPPRSWRETGAAPQKGPHSKTTTFTHVRNAVTDTVRDGDVIGAATSKGSMRGGRVGSPAAGSRKRQASPGGNRLGPCALSGHSPVHAHTHTHCPNPRSPFKIHIVLIPSIRCSEDQHILSGQNEPVWKLNSAFGCTGEALRVT